MLCYQDKTFCGFYKECSKSKKCSRKLTDDIKENAILINLPIAQFSFRPECFKKEKGK